jgi:alcohol dehydrogenase
MALLDGDMRAILVEEFGVRPVLAELPAPAVPDDGVVLAVQATGLCRSDWHGWQGHDPDIVLPHVPGHELAGTVLAVGRDVQGWATGDRATAPFILACGSCRQCAAGDGQVCARQQQPGFTYWGSFAEQVAIPWAQRNLIRLPDAISFDEAAGLGCRFATAYRAVRQVGQVAAGEWVAVFGCGGAGLSAVMIAAAGGAQVVAVDVNPAALELAARHGAAHVLVAGPGTAGQIRELTGGGAQVTVDAIGASPAVQSALRSLAPRGRHVQIGLLPGDVTLDMAPLISGELQWLGSHGMAAREYPAMLDFVASGAARPGDLVTRVIGLDDVPGALAAMSGTTPPGITIIRPSGP